MFWVPKIGLQDADSVLKRNGKEALIHVEVFVYLATFLKILIHVLSISFTLATDQWSASS